MNASASGSWCKSLGFFSCQSTLLGPLFFSPFRAVRLHFFSDTSSDCNPCKQSEWPWWLYPLRARTSRRDVLSHDNFVSVVGSGWGSGKRGEDELVMWAPLSHGGGTAGPVTSGTRVRSWWAPLSLRSSPCLDRLLPAADSSWQTCSSASMLTWTHCPALSIMSGL